MAHGSTFHHISFRSTILVSYLLHLESFTFRSINQKYQKYYFTVYPSLSDLTLQITMKGLTTPLSRWVQVGVCLCRYSVACAFSPTGLIPWFTKDEGNTFSTLLHHPFIFKGKTNPSSRNSRKNFWRRCRGDLRQVKTYQVPIINLIFSITLFAIRLSVSSAPLLKQFSKRSAFSSPLFHSSSSLAFCVLVCWIACFITTAQENTKLCDFSNTNNNDFISTPIAPVTNAESCEINAALLNLVMKDQFSGLPSEDAGPHLNIFVEL